jgi:hypothetical protein
MPEITRDIVNYIKEKKISSWDNQQTLDAIWGLVLDIVISNTNKNRDYISLEPEQSFNESTNDFREEVETLVLNVMNTPRHIAFPTKV